MKKIIIAVMVMLFGMAYASAQDYERTYFELNTTDGGKIRFMFDDEPEMTFDGEEIVITDYSGESVRYAMANVANLTFDKLTVSVEGVEADDAVQVAISKESISVSGLAANAEVALYSLSGAKVASATADTDGNAVVSLEGIAGGVYVAAMPGHTFKFIR